MHANGPIALETPTAICAMGFVKDPELPPVDTPHGALAFIQVVGLTDAEERAAKHWRTEALLDIFLPHMPLWITDLGRASLHDQPEIAAAIKAGSERDGSSASFLYTDVLGVREHKRLLRAPSFEIRLGARQVEEIGTLLPLRIPFGQPFTVVSADCQLKLEAGSACAVRIDGQAATVTLDSASAQAFATSVRAREGSYRLATLPALAWLVQPTLIRDGEGNVVERIG